MSDKRQIVLDVAGALFREHGYRAVGIDRIIAESGVAKMTMYKYFPSKNALIEAVLHERDQRFRAGLAQAVASLAAPAGQLRALFLWHHHWFNEASFNGCMFINAVAEFPQPDQPIRHAAVRHKAQIEALIETILAPALGVAARRLAAQLAQLLDGAIVSAQMAADGGAAFLAWRSAAGLLQLEGVPAEVGPAFEGTDHAYLLSDEAGR